MFSRHEAELNRSADRSNSSTAIKVTNLSKFYQIYSAPRDRLKQFILPRAYKILLRKEKQYFREFWALRDVSIEIKKGETVGIIGRNGSGKSTLLQIICGTLAPSSGQVHTHGRIAALLELGSGFNPEFTGRENVYMAASLYGLTDSEISERIQAIADFAEIGDFLDQPVKTYSSGMYVRLAFSVVAHVDADILVIDEALAVGDAVFTQKCMRFLRRFKENGTLLFVSHDAGAVTGLCDRAIWLHRGVLKASGTAKAVSEAYLQSMYNETNPPPQSQQHKAEKNEKPELSRSPVRKDQRANLINNSQYRNDIEVFEFQEQESAEFGIGGARITNVSITDSNGCLLSYIVGGEEVIINIEAIATQDIDQPIIGFSVKDRLGQVLFGDNTYLTTRDHRVYTPAGTPITASFGFTMPILPNGDYSIAAAIAEGTQDDHVQHHWIHDALIIKSISSSVSTGLVGIPMHHISLQAGISHTDCGSEVLVTG